MYWFHSLKIYLHLSLISRKPAGLKKQAMYFYSLKWSSLLWIMFWNRTSLYGFGRNISLVWYNKTFRKLLLLPSLKYEKNVLGNSLCTVCILCLQALHKKMWMLWLNIFSEPCSSLLNIFTRGVQNPMGKNLKLVLGRVFNNKLGCFNDVHVLVYVEARPQL